MLIVDFPVPHVAGRRLQPIHQAYDLWAHSRNCLHEWRERWRGAATIPTLLVTPSSELLSRSIVFIARKFLHKFFALQVCTEDGILWQVTLVHTWALGGLEPFQQEREHLGLLACTVGAGLVAPSCIGLAWRIVLLAGVFLHQIGTLASALTRIVALVGARCGTTCCHTVVHLIGTAGRVEHPLGLVCSEPSHPVRVTRLHQVRQVFEHEVHGPEPLVQECAVVVSDPIRVHHISRRECFGTTVS